jgi:hypothetical protein
MGTDTESLYELGALVECIGQARDDSGINRVGFAGPLPLQVPRA